MTQRNKGAAAFLHDLVVTSLLPTELGFVLLVEVWHTALKGGGGKDLLIEHHFIWKRYIMLFTSQKTEFCKEQQKS